MLRRCSLLLDGRALFDADRIVAAGMADRRASSEIALAKLPKPWAFAVVAGVETVLDGLSRWKCDERDVQELRRVAPISDELALRLSRLSLAIDVDAVPDGTVVFPRTPLVTIEGPFLET